MSISVRLISDLTGEYLRIEGCPRRVVEQLLPHHLILGGDEVCDVEIERSEGRRLLPLVEAMLSNLQTRA